MALQRLILKCFCSCDIATFYNQNKTLNLFILSNFNSEVKLIGTSLPLHQFEEYFLSLWPIWKICFWRLREELAQLAGIGILSHLRGDGSYSDGGSDSRDDDSDDEPNYASRKPSGSQVPLKNRLDPTYEESSLLTKST